MSPPIRHSRIQQARQRGAGLVGVLVGAAGVSVVLASMIVWLSHLAEERTALMLRSTRDRIAEQVKSQSEMAAAVSASSTLSGPGNRELLRCLTFGDGTCRATDAARPRSFRLAVPFDPAEPPRVVAGTTRQPVMYSAKGRQDRCKPSKKCPFEVVTYFWASCAGAPPCDRANRINIRRRVSVAPGVKFDSGATPGPVPNDREWADSTVDSVSVLVDDIMQDRNECNPGARLVGLDERGAIICGCMPGFTENPRPDAKGRLVCDPNGQFCTGKEVFQGFDKLMKPICVLPVQEDYTCKKIKIGAKTGKAACPGRDWKMRALSVGEDCYMVKKGAQDIVECPNVEMTCCTLK